MAVVYKYPLGPRDNYVRMPARAKVVGIGFQGETLQIWCAVDLSRVPVTRCFRVVATGQNAPELDGEPIGVAFHPDGLVFHVFDYGDQP